MYTFLYISCIEECAHAELYGTVFMWRTYIDRYVRMYIGNAIQPRGQTDMEQSERKAYMKDIHWRPG